MGIAEVRIGCARRIILKRIKTNRMPIGCPYLFFDWDKQCFHYRTTGSTNQFIYTLIISSVLAAPSLATVQLVLFGVRLLMFLSGTSISVGISQGNISNVIVGNRSPVIPSFHKKVDSSFHARLRPSKNANSNLNSIACDTL